MMKILIFVISDMGYFFVVSIHSTMSCESRFRIIKYTHIFIILIYIFYNINIF